MIEPELFRMALVNFSTQLCGSKLVGYEQQMIFEHVEVLFLGPLDYLLSYQQSDPLSILQHAENAAAHDLFLFESQ